MCSFGCLALNSQGSLKNYKGLFYVSNFKKIRIFLLFGINVPFLGMTFLQHHKQNRNVILMFEVKPHQAWRNELIQEVLIMRRFRIREVLSAALKRSHVTLHHFK